MISALWYDLNEGDTKKSPQSACILLISLKKITALENVDLRELRSGVDGSGSKCLVA